MHIWVSTATSNINNCDGRGRFYLLWAVYCFVPLCA